MLKIKNTCAVLLILSTIVVGSNAMARGVSCYPSADKFVQNGADIVPCGANKMCRGPRLA